MTGLVALALMLGGLGLSVVSGDDDVEATPRDDGGDGLDIGGGDDADVIGGTDFDDIINGSDGNDIIGGFNGDDELFGGNGDDDIFGGLGADLVSGGAGDDFLVGEQGEDTISGGAGDDFIVGIENLGAQTNNPLDLVANTADAGDVLNGGDGNDLILLGDLDTATGGAGDDVFEGGDWIEDDRSATITDFDPKHDSLQFEYFSATEPAVELTEVGGDTEVRLDGQLVVILEGTTGVDPATIDLLPIDLTELAEALRDAPAAA